MSPEFTQVLVFASLVAICAGMVKGIVGFAMPLMMIAGLSTVLPPELALAGLIMPTLVTNLWQAMRRGVKAAWDSMRKFTVFLLVGFVFLVMSAQLVKYVPSALMLTILGVPITIYSLLGLLGRPLKLPARSGRATEAVIGGVAGFFGGISGVWGPATVVMLTARDIDKDEHLRVQGVIYGLGSIALVGSHIASGVLNAETTKFSVVLILPAVIGMAVGFWIHDRINQQTFVKLTFTLLFIAGLNLLRRGILG